jgi:hypothetical protein
MLVWSRGTADADRQILCARLWRHGGLGPIRNPGAISDPGLYGDVIPRGHVALDDDNEGVIAWNREPDYGSFTVWARTVHRDGTLGRAVRIRENSSYGDLAMAPHGRANSSSAATVDCFTGRHKPRKRQERPSVDLDSLDRTDQVKIHPPRA